MQKKKVLITGASKGIGLAIAKKIAPHYHLILHASKTESFDQVPENATLLCADFTNPEELNIFCKQLKKEHGDDLYAVINNAGLTFDNGLIYQSEKAIDAMIQVNLKAPVMISKTALKLFIVRKCGVIINMGSVVGETGNAFQAVYASTKAGLIAFSKSLAQEAGQLLDEHQVRVLSVSPGFIETAMTRDIPETMREKYQQLIPARQFGMTEQVADLISFLLSEQSSYINGTNVHINGGLI